jgi:hypothetical protein
LSLEGGECLKLLSRSEKLVAGDKRQNDNFGFSVGLSSDGSKLVVGAPYEDDGSFGSAYVYAWDEGEEKYTQEAKLVDGENSDSFGFSVSMCADGSKIVVGARYENPDDIFQAGSAYVFAWNGETWTQEAKLVADDKQAVDLFGHSVSMSADGSRVIVGAPHANPDNYENAGSAYVYAWNGATWMQEDKLVPDAQQTFVYFGGSVSMSADGSKVVVGAGHEDLDDIIEAGSAYVFERNEATWTKQAKLAASDKSTRDFFGTSVSISADGSKVVVGAPYQEFKSPNAGSAYVFAWNANGATWTQEARLAADDQKNGDNFGFSVSISAKGSRIIMGAFQADPDNTFEAGSAYVFAWDGETWTQEAQLVANDKQGGDAFGFAASMSADGSRIIFGAPFEDPQDVNDAGSAYVWTSEKC